MAMVTRKTIRSVALPAEHGGWSFWLEPVLLAMLVAPSATGLAIVILSLASFLMRQPLKIAWIDLRKKKLYARTRVAVGFVGIYGVIALLASLASLVGGGLPVLAPLIPAYIIALIQVWQFDTRGNSRHWLPEILGASIMSAFAISIALAGGWSPIQASILAIIIITRAIPTIVYVRTRLNQIKSGHGHTIPPMILHTIAIGVIVLLIVTEYSPVLVLVGIIILWLRAFYFLRSAPVIPAKVLGVQEILFGLQLIILTAIGFNLSL